MCPFVALNFTDTIDLPTFLQESVFPGFFTVAISTVTEMWKVRLIFGMTRLPFNRR